MAKPSTSGPHGSALQRRYRALVMAVTPTGVALVSLYWLSPWSNFPMPKVYALALFVLAAVVGVARIWWRMAASAN